MFSAVKKRKIDQEHRQFKDEWTEKFFFIESKPDVYSCLICLERIAVPKEYNIRRHCESKHSQYKDLQGEARIKKAGELKTQLAKQQGVFAQKKKESECATFASYKVARLIARSARPFTDGDFVKDCLMEICEAVCKEKKDVFTNVPLSRMSIQQRIVDMADNCSNQLKMQCKDVMFFSAALD